MKTLFLTFIAALLVGCQSAIFTPYVGEQQVWRTEPGAFARTVKGISIYSRGEYPSRPYDMIGTVTCEDRDSCIVSAVRDHQADAAITLGAHSSTGSVTLPGSSQTTYNAYSAYGQMNGYASTYSSPSITVPITTTFIKIALIRFITSQEAKLKVNAQFLKWAEEHKNGSGAVPSTATQPAKPAYSVQEIASMRAAAILEQDTLLYPDQFDLLKKDQFILWAERNSAGTAAIQATATTPAQPSYTSDQIEKVKMDVLLERAAILSKISSTNTPSKRLD